MTKRTMQRHGRQARSRSLRADGRPDRLQLHVGNAMFESDKLDYRAVQEGRASLDVPPDLTQLQKDNRYAIPDGRGVATASGMQQKGVTPAGVPVVCQPATPIGVAGSAAVKVERNGNQRWLVVKQTPEQLWPQLKQFWA